MGQRRRLTESLPMINTQGRCAVLSLQGYEQIANHHEAECYAAFKGYNYFTFGMTENKHFVHDANCWLTEEFQYNRLLDDTERKEALEYLANYRRK